MRKGRLCALAADCRGATILEFAMIAPVMIVMVMGLGELTYEAYVQSILSGAMQKAGRDSAIEAAEATQIDARVLGQVAAVAPRATIIANANGKPRRSSYAMFGYIRPEPFEDKNNDKVRNSGECFTDYNGNGIWDADPGTEGMGGASDSVVYQLTISYPRLFPLAGSLGWGALANASATTIIKNQPYAAQNLSTPQRICT